MEKTRVKLEETKDMRRLHIGSIFVDLNESEYQELVKIFASQFRTEGASTVPTDEEVRKACPEDCLSDWILGAKWMREKMLKAKGAEYDVLREKINKYQDDSLKHLNEFRHYKIKKEKELEELKAENEKWKRAHQKQLQDNDALVEANKKLKTLQPNNTLSKDNIWYKQDFIKANAATSAEAVKKAIEALEEMLYDVSINAHMTSKINKVLSLLKQSNHQ